MLGTDVGTWEQARHLKSVFNLLQLLSGGLMLPRSICGQFVLWETGGNIFHVFNICTAFGYAFGVGNS